jgi:GDSL-like lipase/acylhydrolase family protein
MRAWTVAALTAAIVAATGAGTGAARVVAYPSALAVLGNGGATGFASNPAHPSRDARSNSWATGANPAVRSVYLRILARNPAVRGHNANFAQNGATLKELAGQVRRATARRVKPELVLVQIGDDDMRCDGRDASRYDEFQAGLTTQLQALAAGLPKARILVVSPWGSVGSYIRAIQSLGQAVRLEHAGKGPCSLFAPRTGAVVPAHVAYVKQTLAGFAGAMAAACDAVPTCTYDRGAASRMTVTAADLGWRHQHLSVAGHAKLAAIEWSVLFGKEAR